MDPQQPQKTIRVQVPELGTIEFPEGTSPETMEQAIRQATNWKPADPTEGRSAASRAAGGFLNMAGLNPAPLVELGARMFFHPVDTTIQMGKNLVAPLGRLGNVGDAFKKAGLTGAANELAASIPILGPAAEHASERGKSGDTAGMVGEIAGMIAGPTLVTRGLSTAARAAAPAVTRTAEGLMQSALKPGVARMRDVIKGKTPVPPVVQTMLKEGISVSDSGVGKVARLLDASKQDLENIIAGSSADIYPADVATRAMTSRGRIANQVNRRADVAAFNDAIDEFLRDYGGVTGFKPMPVKQAQALKTGTYENVTKKAYGELKSGSVEGQKALARGLKEEIENAIPNADVKGVNRRIGDLTEAQEAVGRRVGVANNRDPGGFAPLAHRAENFLAILLLRHPGVKSMLARGLYQSAARAAGVPEGAIRAALLAVAQQSQNQEPE